MLTINSVFVISSHQLIYRVSTLQSFLFTQEPTIHALQIAQVFPLKIKLNVWKIYGKNLESLRQTATQYLAMKILTISCYCCSQNLLN